ncbi:MAG: hypothetical protein IPM54_43470 [Polyangiaceae bacterium]|nr:hypothetical protein [Polyangiaceae bacterium]
MRDSYGDGNRRGMVPLLSPVGCGVRLGKNNAAAGLGTGFFSQQALGWAMERVMATAPMNDDDYEPVTQVITQKPMTMAVVGNEVHAATTYDATIHERQTLPESTPRDTVVDVTPSSAFERLGARLREMGRDIWRAFQRPRLTDRLPPIPTRNANESTRLSAGVLSPEEWGERMLLEIMRAPPEYVRAALLIAKATQMLHARGDDVFAEGVVAFALSRMCPDANGTISVRRLRERLHEMPFARRLTVVLLRLEEQGVIELEMLGDDAPLYGVSYWEGARIRLLVQP